MTGHRYKATSLFCPCPFSPHPTAHPSLNWVSTSANTREVRQRSKLPTATQKNHPEAFWKHQCISYLLLMFTISSQINALIPLHSCSYVSIPNPFSCKHSVILRAWWRIYKPYINSFCCCQSIPWIDFNFLKHLCCANPSGSQSRLPSWQMLTSWSTPGRIGHLSHKVLLNLFPY